MKRGFTLIEVLAVMSILSIIMLIAFPTYNGISQNIKKSTLDNKIKIITSNMLKYANSYLLDDIKPAGNNCSVANSCCKKYDLYNYIVKYSIYLADYNDTEILNPLTNRKLVACIKVSYNTSKQRLEAIFQDSCEISASSLGIAGC